MLEIILLAITTFFIIRKLKSILGEEHDQYYFGYNQHFNSKMKDAEKVETINDDKNVEDSDFDYLSNDAKKYCHEISKKINNFSLITFQSIASKVLECVIKANNERNKDDITMFLSADLADLVCSSFDNEDKNHIILVSLNSVKICDILKNDSIYDIVVEFQTEQINYTTNKDDEIIDGSKSEVLEVKERWHFSHNFSKKDNTWFVSKIEAIN